jgi:hypothetical protein
MMAMYAHILSSVLDDWVDELTGTALVAYALVCRTEMLSASLHRGDPACTVLAAEIGYDRALCKLCEDNGIAIDALSFAHPAKARARLEAELSAAGIDLVDLARRPRP